MRLAIMQPYFLPYIGYIQLINAVDTFVFYDDVNYINRGWINRNRFLMNGQDALFTVPLKDASQNKLINQVMIADDAKWRSKMLKTWEQSYKKAPYFEPVFDLLQAIVHTPTHSIAELVWVSFEHILPYLQINTRLVKSSEIYQNSALKAQERILDICKQEAANHYINPIGGIELYDKAFFEEQKIKLNFIRSTPIHYPQFKNEFVPWLSILDILMFNDLPSIHRHLEAYELC